MACLLKSLAIVVFFLPLPSRITGSVIPGGEPMRGGGETAGAHEEVGAESRKGP